MLKFLKDYYAWLQAGAPDNEPFSRKVGLCSNINEKYGFDAKLTLRRTLRDTMKDAVYPFNKNGNEYNDEVENQTMHLNPKRIEWVKKMINAK